MKTGCPAFNWGVILNFIKRENVFIINEAN